MKTSIRNALALAASVLLLFGAYAATVVTIMLSGATATGAGSAFDNPQADKTYQAYGSTAAGTGTAALTIEGSNDGTHWNTVVTTTVAMTSATLAVSAGITATDRYAYSRVNVTTLSGSTPTLTVTRSY
jgi:hypothetical protein